MKNIKRLLFFGLLALSLSASAQFPGTGYRIARDNAVGAHFGVFNANLAGYAGFIAALPTGALDTAYLILKSSKGVLRSTLPLDIQTPTLTLNGSPFSGGSLWSTSAGKIYYNTNFVGIGTATVPYPLSVQTNSNSDADVGVYFRNVAGTHTLSFFNDKFLALQSAQPEFTMRATLSDTTVPRASIQFRDHLGVATGSIYNKANSLYLSATTGRVIVAGRRLEVQDGGFRVYDLTGGRDLFSTSYLTGRTLVGPGVAEVNSTLTVRPLGTNRQGTSINMDGAGTTGNVIGLAVKVDDDNAAQENIGVLITTANAGGGGVNVPIATVEPGLVAGWEGANMRVVDVSPSGMLWKAYPKPYAQRGMTYVSTGGWDQRTPVSVGAYFAGLDSLVSQGGTWAANSLTAQHMTSATNGSFTYTGWTDNVTVEAEALLNISSDMGTGSTSVFGCRWALNGTGITHTEQRRYLPSSHGPQQLIIKGLFLVDAGDVLSVQCVCGVSKALITYYSVNLSVTPVE